jgi:hypothetical protein
MSEAIPVIAVQTPAPATVVEAGSAPRLPAAPLATLSYESGVNAPRLGQSRWGTASLLLTAITVVYCIVCGVGMSRARGWDGLGWLIVGLIGNWVGCGLAAISALVGVCQRRRGRRLAAHALWVSLVIGLGPITLLWLGALR